MRASFFVRVGFSLLFAGALAVDGQTGVALVRRAPSLNGTVEGSLRLTLPENVTLNGSAVVTGDVLLPGLPIVQSNGKPSFGGVRDGIGAATPATHRVTINGGASLRHVVRRTDPVPLPAIALPPAPTGTRDVALNQAGQTPGNFATLRNLTLNGNVGPLAVPPGAYGTFIANGNGGFILGVAGSAAPTAYSFRTLALNGNSGLQVVGPVVVTLGSGISTNAALGKATQPEWLQLRIAGGGLTVNGNGAVHARVEAPDGTVALNGGSRLVGALTADRLVLNGNSVLCLLATAPANRSPTVKLTAPFDGASLTAPASFALVAQADDSDGTVSNVEFFVDGASIGFGALLPDSPGLWSLAFTTSTAQSIAFSAKATDNLGASATSASIAVKIAPSISFALPLLAGFEAAEGYTLGALHGQRGWTASSSVTNAESDSFTGGRSALVPGAIPPLTLSRPFDPHPGQGIVFVDLFVLPRAAANEDTSALLSTLGGAAIAFVQDGAAGRLSAFHGDGMGGGVWQRLMPAIALDSQGYAADWLRLTSRLDYTAQRWDFYIDGVLAAYDLSFRQAGLTQVGSFTLTGQASAPTLMDDFLAGFDNPVFADADRDSMADAWEIAHGLNATLNDRDLDADADGLANILESLLRTKPNAVDSDADELPDAWERVNGTNPVLSDAVFDPDGDGLTNAHEFVAGTSPRSSDSDGDGLPDGWESLHGLNALVPADALLDPDGDGFTNLQEFQQGKDPADFFNGEIPVFASLLAADGALGPGDTLSVRVTTAAGVLLPNAPVKFMSESGGHLLAATADGVVARTVSVRTGTDGVATVFVKRGTN